MLGVGVSNRPMRSWRAAVSALAAAAAVVAAAAVGDEGGFCPLAELVDGRVAARGTNRAASSPPWTTTPVFTSGGLVMTEVVVQPIFAGTSWVTSSVHKTRMSNVVKFFENAGTSRSGLLVGVSEEYLNGAQVPVSVLSPYVRNETFPELTVRYNPKTNMMDFGWVAEWICELRAAKALGKPPAKLTSMYYPIYVEAQGTTFCGYHDYLLRSCDGDFDFSNPDSYYFTLGVHVSPERCEVSGISTPGISDLDNQLISISAHELVEAITDPSGLGWTWNGAFYGHGSNMWEISDLCRDYFGRSVQAQILEMGNNTFVVPLQYSNAAGGCVATANRTMPTSSPTTPPPTDKPTNQPTPTRRPTTFSPSRKPTTPPKRRSRRKGRGLWVGSPWDEQGADNASNASANNDRSFAQDHDGNAHADD